MYALAPMRTSSCLASRGFATMARKEQTKHKTHEREHLHTINQAPTATSTRTDVNNNVRSHLGSGLRVRSAQVRYPDGRVCGWVYPFSGGLSSIFIPPTTITQHARKTPEAQEDGTSALSVAPARP